MVHARRKAADILKTNKKAKLAAQLVSLLAPGQIFPHNAGLILSS